MFNLNDESLQDGVKEFPVAKQKQDEPNKLIGVPARLVDIVKHDPTAKAGCSIEFIYSYHPTNKEKQPDTKDVNFGAKTGHRIFDPNGGTTVQTDEKKERNIKDTQGALKHIIGCFAKPEELKNLKPAKTFDELIDNIIEFFNNINYKEIPCRVKVIYNSSGYTSFPRYPNFVSSPLKPSDFGYNPNYDHLVKPQQAPTGADILGGGMDIGFSGEDENDMPF